MNKLTDKQRRELRAILKPIVERSIADGVQPFVRQEIEKLAKGGGGSTSYLERAQRSGEHPSTRRGRDLLEAARVFARLGLIQAAAAGDRATALDMARNLDVEDHYRKAMSAGSAADGGLLIADDFADEIIELLRPMSVVRRLPGIREVTIPRGTLQTPRIDVGVSSGYVAEGNPIPRSGAKTGGVVLLARKLATIVDWNNELSQFTADSGFNADEIILDDMLASIGTTEDVAFLFGSGTASEPLGITKWAVAANKFDATQAGAAATLTEVQADLRTAEQLLLDADVPMRNPVWILSPRSRLFLRDLRDTEDRGVFGDEMRQSGTINGIPFAQTNNIPNNLGTGNDESLVILVDAAEVMLGDVAQIAVDRSDSAVLDGVSLFQRDRRALRVRQWNDLILRHDVGAAVIEAVRWGA